MNLDECSSLKDWFATNIRHMSLLGAWNFGLFAALVGLADAFFVSIYFALPGWGHNKRIDPLIGTMAGRKRPPQYDKDGNQVRGKQFKMNHTRTQSSDDGACLNRAIGNRMRLSCAITVPFMGLEFDWWWVSKHWVSLYEGTAFGIVPSNQQTPFRSFVFLIVLVIIFKLKLL
jgi:hypothetical protein